MKLSSKLTLLAIILLVGILSISSVMAACNGANPGGCTYYPKNNSLNIAQIQRLSYTANKGSVTDPMSVVIYVGGVEKKRYNNVVTGGVYNYTYSGNAKTTYTWYVKINSSGASNTSPTWQYYTKDSIKYNLLSYYSFEDNYTDASYRNFNGAGLNTPLFKTGKIGKGVQANITGMKLVQYPYGANMKMNVPITINFWIRSLDTTNAHHYFSSSDGAGSTQDFLIKPDVGEIYVISPSPNFYQTFGSPNKISSGRWAMVTLVTNATSFNGYKLYINGTLQTRTGNGDAGMTTSTYYRNFELGGTSNNAARVNNGLFDEAAIWNRSLTPAEITTLWNSGSGNNIMQTAPTVSNATPSNAPNQNLTLNLSALILDDEANQMTIKFFVNNTLQCTLLTQTNGQKRCEVTVAKSNTNYTWNVTVNDSYYVTKRQYNFTTAGATVKSPSYSDRKPANDTSDLNNTNQKFSVRVNKQGSTATMSLTFYINGTAKSVINAINNGTYYNFTSGPLRSNKTYNWNIKINSSTLSNTSPLWYFTTKNIIPYYTSRFPPANQGNANLTQKLSFVAKLRSTSQTTAIFYLGGTEVARYNNVGNNSQLNYTTAQLSPNNKYNWAFKLNTTYSSASGESEVNQSPTFNFTTSNLPENGPYLKYYWTLNGDAYDTIENSYPTISNAKSIKAYIDGGYNFNAVNSKITYTNVNVSMDQIAIVFWIYRNSSTPSAQTYVMADAAGTQNGMEFSSGTSHCSFYNITGSNAYPGSNIPIGSWAHVVCQKNDTDVSTYVNGVFQASMPLKGKIRDIGTNTLRLGSDYTTTNIFNGSLDEVKIYNKAFTQQQINNLYQKDILISQNTLKIKLNGTIFTSNVYSNYTIGKNTKGGIGVKGGALLIDGKTIESGIMLNATPSTYSLFDGTKNNTVSFWVNAKNFKNFNNILSPAYYNNYIRIESDGKLWAARNIGGSWRYTSSPVLSKNQWYHAVIITNTSYGQKMFLNGILISENTTKGAVSTNAGYSNLYIGRSTSSNQVFNGSFDEFLILDKAISNNEAIALYQNGNPTIYSNYGYESNTFFYSSFDELTDITGYNSHATSIGNITIIKNKEKLYLLNATYRYKSKNNNFLNISYVIGKLNSTNSGSWCFAYNQTSDSNIVPISFTNAGNTAYLRVQMNSGKVNFLGYDGANGWQAQIDNIIYYNKMTFYCFVKRPTTAEIWINGINQSLTWTTTSHLDYWLDGGKFIRGDIGGYLGSQPINGTIAALQLYNKSLSNSEINDLYTQIYYAAAPLYSNMKPIDNTINANITQKLSIKAIRQTANPLTVIFYLNGTEKARFNDVINNTVLNYTTQVLSYSKNYTWYVKLNESFYETITPTLTFSTPNIGLYYGTRKIINNTLNANITGQKVSLIVNKKSPNYNMTVTFYLNGVEQARFNNIANNTQVNYTLGLLSSKTIYSWYVKLNTSLYTNTTPEWIFTTIDASGYYTDRKPANNTLNANTTQKLSIKAFKKNNVYPIDVIYYFDGAKVQTTNNVANNTIVEYTSPLLGYGTRHYWYVIINSSYVSNTTPTWYFNTTTKPPTYSNRKPANNTLNANLTQKLSIKAIKGSLNPLTVIFYLNGTEKVRYNDVINNTVLNYTTPLLSSNKRYNWSVRLNTSTKINDSPVWLFTTPNLATYYTYRTPANNSYNINLSNQQLKLRVFKHSNAYPLNVSFYMDGVLKVTYNGVANGTLLNYTIPSIASYTNHTWYAILKSNYFTNTTPIWKFTGVNSQIYFINRTILNATAEANLTQKLSIVAMKRSNSYTLDVNFYLNGIKVQTTNNVANNTKVDYTTPPLNYGSLYNWSVKLNTSKGSNITDTWIFYTLSKSPAYSNRKPANNTLNANLTQKLSIKAIRGSPNPLTVIFYLNGTEKVRYNNVINNTVLNYTTPTLSFNKRYNWSVRLNTSTKINLTPIWLFNTTNITLNIYSPIAGQRYNATFKVNFTVTTGQTVDKRWFYNGTHNITYTNPVNLLLADGSHTFKFYANTTNGVRVNKSVTFSIDKAIPVITILSPVKNSKNLNISSIFFNMTFFDTNLYGWNFTCKNRTGATLFSNETINILGTTDNLTRTLYFYKTGIINCTAVAVDDHTANTFNPKVNVNNKFLGFGTDKLTIDNNIEIIYDDTNTIKLDSISYEKSADRVSPVFNLDQQDIVETNQLTKQLKVEIEAAKIPKLGKDGKLIKPIIPELPSNEITWTVKFKGSAESRSEVSGIKGHIVIIPTTGLKDGYWYDAESDTDSTISYMINGNEVKYSMKFNDQIPGKIVSKSLGGLNINTEKFFLNMTPGGYTRINASDYFTNAKLGARISINNGTHTTVITNMTPYIAALSCNRYTIKLTNVSYMNNYTVHIGGCNSTRINAPLYRAIMYLTISDPISLLPMINVTINITNSTKWSQQRVTTISPEPFFVNSSPFVLKINKTGYSVKSISYNLPFRANISYTTALPLYINPIYNTSFYREKNGDVFSFTETTSSYTCNNGTQLNNTFAEEAIPTLFSCNGAGNLSTTHPCVDAFDGVYNTFALGKNDLLAKANFNYTKPLDATNHSYLKLYLDTIQGYKIYNMTQWPKCWAKNPLEFSTELNASAGKLTLKCKNATTWTTMAVENNGGLLAEAPTFWAKTENVTKTKTCANTTSVYIETEVFCTNKVLSSNLTESMPQLTNINCSYDYWYLKIKYPYSDQTYLRFVKPPLTNHDPKIYIIDLNKDSAVQIFVYVTDLANVFNHGQIVVYKYINGTKTNVIQTYLRADKSAELWLTKYESYELCFIDDLNQEKCAGQIVASQSGTMYLNLPLIPFYDKKTYSFTNVSGGLNSGCNTTLTYSYFDTTQAGANSIFFIIKDINGNIKYQNQAFNTKSVNLTITGINTNQTLTYEVIVDHKNLGTFGMQKSLCTYKYGSFNGWEVGESNLIKLIIACLVPILVLSLFSILSVEWGLLMASIFVFVFNAVGWYISLENTLMTTSISILSIFLFAFSIITIIKKVREGAYS